MLVHSYMTLGLSSLSPGHMARVHCLLGQDTYNNKFSSASLNIVESWTL